jgi:carbamoyl-phosphate synthase large subunit
VIRRRTEVFGAIVFCIAVAIVGFRWLNVPMRDGEMRAVADLLGLVSHSVSLTAHHTFQVLPAAQQPFRAHVTPYCSSLVSILALGGIGFFIMRGALWRRALSFVAAAVFILACNVVRIAASLAVGLRYGDRSLVLFHDWVGTMFGLAYTMGGFFFMLWLLLPSAKNTTLRRAARVSDVL